MSYALRAVFYADVVVDEVPSDLEACLREAIEDGSADLALCGTTMAQCNICDLAAEFCGCVADDDDAYDLDQSQRQREAA